MDTFCFEFPNFRCIYSMTNLIRCTVVSFKNHKQKWGGNNEKNSSQLNIGKYIDKYHRRNIDLNRNEININFIFTPFGSGLFSIRSIFSKTHFLSRPYTLSQTFSPSYQICMRLPYHLSFTVLVSC